MTATLRTLAAETGQSTGRLMQRLELVPAHHNIDAPLTPRVEAIYRVSLRFRATTDRISAAADGLLR